MWAYSPTITPQKGVNMENSYFKCDLTLNAGGGISKHKLKTAAAQNHFDVQHRLSIYVIYSGERLLYVGESYTGIGAMITGHTWDDKHAGETLTVFFFSFDKAPDDLLANKPGDEVIRRTIESEVTYSLRESTGRWPLRQHEIHFYAEYAEHPFIIECRDYVMEILTKTDNARD